MWLNSHWPTLPFTGTSPTRPAILKVRSLGPLGDPNTFSEVWRVITIFIIILMSFAFFTALAFVLMRKRQWWVEVLAP